MKTDTIPPCANCQRLQAEVDALRVQLAALQATVAQLQKQLAAARKDSSTSSKPPSSDIVKPPKPQPPPGQERRQPGGQPGHPTHQRELFPPEMLTSTPTDYVLDACPACGGHLVVTDAEPSPSSSSRSTSRPPRWRSTSTAVIPGWCAHCRQDPLCSAAAADRARWPGRAATDHPDRLPQGGLSCLVLDHPQVPPRRARPDDLAGATGQDHRQGQPGAGAALRGVAPATCPRRPSSMSMRRGTRRTAKAVDLVLPGRAVHAVQDRPHAERRCVIEVLGPGVRRGAGVRLLLGLSAVSSRVRRGYCSSAWRT